ncbi:MAG: SPFH domain-containing protein [Lachnospiraceae bacterium]|nr:SPFH domain-containing protein [Lachnospiraceae bacterium]
MGLISTAIGSVTSTLSDQYKEFFYCEALPANVLVTKGRPKKQTGSDNIITSGSVVTVADGQAMMIVDQGVIAEFCAEPGEFVYDASTEPTIFSGNLGDSLMETFKVIGRRFTFGGTPPKDQRVYYVNIKEIMDNKYGTPNPVPFRVVDQRAGIDIDISLRCNGVYSYRICDPMLFYKNVCGNVTADYTRDKIDQTLKSELLTALGPAFAKLSEQGMRYSALPGHTTEIARALNEVLSPEWSDKRGIEIVSFGVNTLSADPEDEKMLKEMQKNAGQANLYSNVQMAAGLNAQADAQAKIDAANNASGAAMGFMGLNVAQAASGNTAGLFAQAAQQQQMQPQPQVQPMMQPAGGAQQGWTCECGAQNTGKFCAQCGKPQPVANGWTCECGAVNQGKFCPQCGKKKPAGALQYKCDKCGWMPEDPANPPKFCPECGDPFGDEDIING